MKKFMPTNPLVGALLTDLYQLTMAYGYWKAGRHEERAVFDLFFRKFPFDGDFALFAGLEEILRLANIFRFRKKDVKFIRGLLPQADDGFFSWLETVNCENVKIFAMDEGSMILPYAPFIIVEGPLAVVQLLETPFLNLVNFASLVATKAARIRLAAGFKKILVEFGLRRSQGPDGGLSASRYSYVGGFDGTSNVLAGKTFDIPVKGTMAHSFIQSFVSLRNLKNQSLANPGGHTFAFVSTVLKIREELGFVNTNEGELAAFISYAQAFPNNFLALVDSYSTLRSGVPNFICVALALRTIGYHPVGIRIDSGDLGALSRKIREILSAVAREQNAPWLKSITIFASDEIDEEKILTMRKSGDDIDGLGIGTKLATCQPTSAFGGVYKLVEIESRPVIKISEEEAKVTFPAKKEVCRIHDKYANAVADLMTLAHEKVVEKEKFVAVNIMTEKRVVLVPSKVTPLLKLVWDGKLAVKLPTIHEIRKTVIERLKNRASFGGNHHTVYASETLWELRRELCEKSAPLPEIR